MEVRKNYLKTRSHIHLAIVLTYLKSRNLFNSGSNDAISDAIVFFDSLETIKIKNKTPKGTITHTIIRDVIFATNIK